MTDNNLNQEEINGNKCLVLVPTDKSKGIMEKYKKLWTKIRDLIRLKTDNSDNYDEKYMKIKLNSDDDLPLKKTLELHNIIIVFRAVSHESNKY